MIKIHNFKLQAIHAAKTCWQLVKQVSVWLLKIIYGLLALIGWAALNCLRWLKSNPKPVRLLKRLTLVVVAFVAAAIGWNYLIEPLPYYTSKNISLDVKDGRRVVDAVPRARLRYRKKDVSPKPFVGIAISGGGSRAANFAAAALFELDRIGVLPHVTALSSVSGGSLTAAHFALFHRHGDETYWPRLRKTLRTNLFRNWVYKTAAPHNLVKLAITDFDRSDAMASVFNDRLFHGAKFKDLGEEGPSLFINATEYTISGTSFPFVEYRFSQLKSKLAEYPIANAVMASGAFPFVFSGVTLTDFSGRKFGKDRQEQFLHLYDGGPADNLGVETLLTAARNYHRAQRKEFGTTANTCFIFVIDAYQGSNLFKGEFSRNPSDLDSNTMDSASTLLIKRRYDLLDQVGFLDLKPIYFPASQLRGYVPIRNFRLFQAGRSKANRAGFRSPSEKAVECMAWHINNDRLIGFALEPDLNSLPSQLIKRDNGPSELLPNVVRQERSQLFSLIDTHYKLTGPKDCSPAMLQETIFDVAHSLVREDAVPLKRVCEWFRSNDLMINYDQCKPPEQIVHSRPPVTFEYVKTKARSATCNPG